MNGCLQLVSAVFVFFQLLFDTFKFSYKEHALLLRSENTVRLEKNGLIKLEQKVSRGTSMNV